MNVYVRNEQVRRQEVRENCQDARRTRSRQFTAGTQESIRYLAMTELRIRVHMPKSKPIRSSFLFYKLREFALQLWSAVEATEQQLCDVHSEDYVRSLHTSSQAVAEVR